MRKITNPDLVPVKDRVTMIKGKAGMPQRFWPIMFVDENLVDHFKEEGYYVYKYDENESDRTIKETTTGS